MAARSLLVLVFAGLTHGAVRVADLLLHPPPVFMFGNLTRQRELARDSRQFVERSVAEQIEQIERRLAELACREYLGENVGGYIRRYEAILTDLRVLQAEIGQRRPR